MSTTLTLQPRIAVSRAFVAAARQIADAWPECPWRIEPYAGGDVEIRDLAGTVQDKADGEQIYLTPALFEMWRLDFLAAVASSALTRFRTCEDHHCVYIKAAGGVRFRCRCPYEHYEDWVRRNIHTDDPYAATARRMATAHLTTWTLCEEGDAV